MFTFCVPSQGCGLIEDGWMWVSVGWRWTCPRTLATSLDQSLPIVFTMLWIEVTLLCDLRCEWLISCNIMCKQLVLDLKINYISLIYSQTRSCVAAEPPNCKAFLSTGFVLSPLHCPPTTILVILPFHCTNVIRCTIRSYQRV